MKNEKLVWTNALAPGYRPAGPSGTASCGEFVFTAVITLEAHGAGTRYRALALHQNEESNKQHASMGFHEGWGTCLDQLVAIVKRDREQLQAQV